MALGAAGLAAPQIVVDLGEGSTTADIFIQPTASHLDDPFTIDLVYNNGGPIAIPLSGVAFNPDLPVLPTVPQAPLELGVTATSTSQVSLSWNASAGAATTASNAPGELADELDHAHAGGDHHHDLQRHERPDQRHGISLPGLRDLVAPSVVAVQPDGHGDDVGPPSNALTLTAISLTSHRGVRMERRRRDVYRHRHFDALLQLHRDHQLGRRRNASGRDLWVRPAHSRSPADRTPTRHLGISTSKSRSR